MHLKIVRSPFVAPKKSAIHGQGLFAKRKIPNGTKLLQYLGEKISKEESNKRGLAREKEAKKDGGGAVYIFDVNDSFDIDGNFKWNIARLANHSCDPNCVMYNVDDEIWLYANREIRKNEEITFDYGYDIDHYEDHPCRCGSKNCVGYIVRKDQRWRLKKILSKKKQKNKRVSGKKHSNKKES